MSGPALPHVEFDWVNVVDSLYLAPSAPLAFDAGDLFVLSRTPRHVGLFDCGGTTAIFQICGGSDSNGIDPSRSAGIRRRLAASRSALGLGSEIMAANLLSAVYEQLGIVQAD